MTLELVPLATMRAELAAPLVLDGTPAGGRYIFEIDAVRSSANACRRS